MNETVIVEESGNGKFQQNITAGKHAFLADEPEDMGGKDTGPAPFDFVMAGLGACTSMTIRMYADLKKIPLTGVKVNLHYSKRELDGKKIDHIEREIALSGDLSETDREKLLIIANKCPVHKALEGNLKVDSRLVDLPQ